MANGESYQQCALTQGERRITAWIPKRAAIEGAKVELLDGTPRQDRDFWHVQQVYAFELSAEALRTKQNIDRKGFLSIERPR